MILNRYRPLGVAGTGGYGTVQVAWDTRMQRRVAVKCMDMPQEWRGGFPDSDVFNELSPSQIPGLEEARTAAMLTHPNIVSVYDFEVSQGVAYLIMEWVDGMTLADLLRAVGDNITLDMVTAVYAGVARALEYAHENQVLHLDIKPANILINHAGQVLVTDFGLARLSDTWGYSAARGGTIGYMPPEQMRQEPLDDRCDEWALASVLYEMISGNNPFLARDIPSAIQAIEGAEIVLPSLCMEGLPGEADDIIFYALDPDRNERYATVRDFDEEISPCLGDEQQGRQQLQQAVSSYLADDDSAEDASPAEVSTGFSFLKPQFREKMSGKVSTVSLRIWALLTSMAAALAELPSFDMLGGWTSPLCALAFAGMLVLAFAVPRAGALASLAVLVAALIVHELYIPAVLIGALGLAWFLLVGNDGDAQANAGTLPFVAGAIGLNQIIPMLSGFFLPIGDALKSVVFAWVLAVFLACFGSGSLLGWNVNLGTLDADALQKSFVALAGDPGTYIVLASWLASAAVVSAFVRRGSRASALVGVLLGGAVLIVGAMLMTAVGSSFANWVPNVNYLVPAIISMLLVGLLGWVYAPERPDISGE
ncbi:MAG: serine/threonine-protein kinase [Eggerthellaceae bacterium]